MFCFKTSRDLNCKELQCLRLLVLQTLKKQSLYDLDFNTCDDILDITKTKQKK